MDLWSQLYLLDRGERLGRTLTAYRPRWFVQDYMGWNWHPREHAAQEVRELIADVCISMRTEDYLQLPERMVVDVPASMPPQARKVYDKLKAEQIAELRGQVITAINSAVVVNKLLQCTAGAVYDQDGMVAQLHKAKIEALQDIIAESGGEPVLVVYQFKHEIAAMRKAFPGLVELRDRSDSVEQWNSGKIQLMAIHPASAGHGINLQHGVRIMVWTTSTYNLGQYQQACARLHRMGQDKPVIIYRINIPGTIDSFVWQVIAGKSELQSGIMEILKA